MKLIGTLFLLAALRLIVWPGRVVAADQTGKSWARDGFEVRLITPQDRNLLRGICAKMQPFDGGKFTSCYPQDWSTWATRRKFAAIPIDKRRQLRFFLSGGGIRQGPATSYLFFPDRSRHVIWSLVDIYGSGELYWLVDPQKRDIDTVWISAVTSYFGPNAGILGKTNIGEWLRTIPFPGNSPP